MSTLYRADHDGTADGPAAAGSLGGDANEAGVYLTDEVFLYRIVWRVGSGAGEMVELEDCFGLDVVHVPLRCLGARRLRVVRPTQAVG